MKTVTLVSLFILLLNTVFAQKKQKLQMGDNISIKNIEVIGEDNKPTHIDLPNKKTLNDDRFVLLFFYSSSSTSKEIIAFNNQVERILTKFQNNPCKGASSIDYVTICAEKEYAKWQTILTETHIANTKYQGKKQHFLAANALKDDLIKVFRVTKMPSLFLVNPLGKLFIETDSTEFLEKTFKNICRANASLSLVDIYGKLMIGEKNKTPLAQHPVFLMKDDIDTLSKTKTDDFGDFVFKQIDTTQNLSIAFCENEKIKVGVKTYLSLQNGEIVSDIKQLIKGRFRYKLLSIDVQRLTEIEEDDDITMKYKRFNKTTQKNLIVSENIYYELGKYNILTENEIVLDKVITILNATSSVNLEIISHTDANGDDTSNLKLSENRSLAVTNYLILKGIDKNRLKGIGRGESQIKNRCINNIQCSDKEHEYNRRTEFKFSKN